MLLLRRLGIALLILTPAASPSHAGWFELGLRSDAVQASAGRHLGSDPQGRFAIGGRGLWNDNHDTKLGAFVARFEAERTSVQGLEFAIGVDVFLGKGENLDVGAAAIGIQASMAPPAWRGGFVGARVAYAPGIFTWSDTERLFEGSVRAGWRATPRIAVFVEYQKIRADFDGAGNRDLDDTLKAGFGGRF